jgi:phage gp36-like protein
MFITDDDYTVQARQEILSLLDDSIDNTVIRRAEQYAIAEIKKRIGGRYNLENVFNKTGEHRDMYIVMITIDIAIYHLYSQKAPRKIPEYRDVRYRDAIEWLVSVGKGETPTTLPEFPPDEYMGDVRVFSLYKPNDNKY